MEPILFILFGAIAVGGAIMVVTRKHPMASALYLILTLFAVAALFVLRQAHFLAAIQVIVYAGAVVVLFIFVIMLINVPENRLPAERVTAAVGGHRRGAAHPRDGPAGAAVRDAGRTFGRCGLRPGRGESAVHRLPACLRDHFGAAPGGGDRSAHAGEKEDLTGMGG
jgi:hypothetical protein